MPSGLGHALGGVIVGLVAGGSSQDRGADETGTVPRPSLNRRELAWLAVAGCAPDLDFFWGRHSAETHSVGATVLVGLAVLAFSKGRNVRLAACVAFAWFSHVAFDWLGSDDTPPLGVMALWPFSDAYYFAHAYVFDTISRRYWLPNFWTHNLIAVVKEAVLLGPLVVALAWWKVREGAGRCGKGAGRREG